MHLWLESLFTSETGASTTPACPDDDEDDDGPYPSWVDHEDALPIGVLDAEMYQETVSSNTLDHSRFTTIIEVLTGCGMRLMPVTPLEMDMLLEHVDGARAHSTALLDLARNRPVTPEPRLATDTMSISSDPLSSKGPTTPPGPFRSSSPTLPLKSDHLSATAGPPGLVACSCDIEVDISSTPSRDSEHVRV